MALIFTRAFNKSWRSFWVTAALQLVFALSVPYLLFIDTNLGSAIAAPITAAAIVGVTAVIIALFGLASYPVVFLLMHRPRLWQRWVGGLLLVYTVAGIPVYGPLYSQLEKQYQKQQARRVTAELFGRLTDADGNPLSRATVQIDGCGYYKLNPLTTDADGRFHVAANCGNELRIRSVEHSAHKTCLLIGENSIAGELGIVFVHRGQHESTPHMPYWGNYSSDRPYHLTCVQEKPQNLKQAQGFFHHLAADGRLHTLVLNANKHTTLGLHEGQRSGELYLKLDFPATADGGSGNGKIVIQAIDGGIQPTEDNPYVLAPEDGYRPEVEFLVDGSRKRYSQSYYYHTYQRQGYGVFEIVYHDYRNGRHDLNVRLIKNTRGERILATRGPFRTD